MKNNPVFLRAREWSLDSSDQDQQNLCLENPLLPTELLITSSYNSKSTGPLQCSSGMVYNFLLSRTLLIIDNKGCLWRACGEQKLFPKQSGNQERGRSSDMIFQIVRSLITHANKYNFIKQEDNTRWYNNGHQSCRMALVW